MLRATEKRHCTLMSEEKKNKNNNVAARMSASVLGLVWAFSRFAFFPLKARAL